MEGQQQQVVAWNNNVDYGDRLRPGYRFRPTDVEIILQYLKPQIEKGTHPPCRLHKVYIYDYTPEELANEYRPCDADQWYFLTQRDRKYLNGKRPSRTTKGNGRWKASAAFVEVYDGKQKVGEKRSLHYVVGNNQTKTPWLMHEYIMNDTDIPVGTGTKLTDWVICKIYKKPDNKKQSGLKNKNDQQEAERIIDQLSPKRQRLSQGDQHPEASNQYGTNQQLTFHSNLENNIYSIQHVQEFCHPTSMHLTSLGASTSTCLHVQTSYDDQSMIVTTPSLNETSLQVLNDVKLGDCYIPDDCLAEYDVFSIEELLEPLSPLDR